MTPRQLLRVLKSRWLAALGLGTLLLVLLAVVFTDQLLPYGFDEIDLQRGRAAPGLAGGHLLGTDELGRDYLARVLVAVRSSVLVAATVVVVSTLIGTVVGLFAGYWPGFVDNLLMRATDGMLTLPGLALLFAVAGLIGGGSPLRLGLVIAVLGWPVLARVLRTNVASLREEPFVHAARGVGASDTRILGRHILPNVAGVVVVHAGIIVPAAILAEASLSFLGFGVQPPTPTLGGLIAESRSRMLTDWWLIVFPGVALAAMCLAANFVGEGIRAAVERRPQPPVTTTYR